MEVKHFLGAMKAGKSEKLIEAYQKCKEEGYHCMVYQVISDKGIVGLYSRNPEIDPVPGRILFEYKNNPSWKDITTLETELAGLRWAEKVAVFIDEVHAMNYTEYSRILGVCANDERVKKVYTAGLEYTAEGNYFNDWDTFCKNIDNIETPMRIVVERVDAFCDRCGKTPARKHLLFRDNSVVRDLSEDKVVLENSSTRYETVCDECFKRWFT